MLDPWNRSYDPTVSDRYMSNLTKSGARGSMIHPAVEAKWDEAMALKRELEPPVTYPEYRADMLKVLCLKVYVYAVGIALVGGLALSVVLALQI